MKKIKFNLWFFLLKSDKNRKQFIVQNQPKQFLIFYPTKKMIKKVLILPVLKRQNIVTSYAQLRPYRQGGYRIEAEPIQNKTVFHNYGHGGSGVSLSYGSAYKVANLFEKQVASKENECAVIGSGIIGMMTALQLTNRGQKVKIYSQKIPKFGQKNNQSMITSQIAPGFWFPYDYLEHEHLQLDLLAQITMNFLKKSIETKRYCAVKYCKTYDQVYLPEVVKRFEKLFVDKSSQIDLDFGNGISQKFLQFTTVKIDMQVWLRQISFELVRGGVEFVTKQFKQNKDILGLKQKYIFNCTGYGSKYLFSDNKMKAYRGHIIEFPNKNPQINDFIFGAKIGKDVIRIYAHQSRILLGLTKQQTQKIQVDQKTVDKLIKNYEGYLRKWTSAAIPEARL